MNRRIADIAKVSVSNCPCCGSAARRYLFDVHEHEYDNTTSDGFPMQECTTCGAWYLDPRPAESTLNLIYPSNYYAYVLDSKEPAATDVQQHRSSFQQRVGVKTAAKRYAPVLRHMQLAAQTRWLDVGCGNGQTLDWLRALHGFSGVGLDLSENAVRHCKARGFEAYVGRFEEWQAPPEVGLFDVVHSSHVIEHVVSPRQYMEKAFQLLKPGGLAVFMTPNTDTADAKFFGKNWGGLHAPRHWALLNRRSAKQLCESTGFEYLGDYFSHNPFFWLWSCHSVAENSLGRPVADALFPSDHKAINSGLFMIARLAAFTFVDLAVIGATGRSGNMLCIARKPLSAS